MTRFRSPAFRLSTFTAGTMRRLFLNHSCFTFGQMLIRKEQTSKKVHLSFDSVSQWIATHNALDNLRQQDYHDRFGFADALRHLAKDYPFQPPTLAGSTPTKNHKGEAL